MPSSRGRNNYAALLGRLYDEIPKSVLAAVAVSALTAGGNELDQAAQRIAKEWGVLRDNGIVSQPPSKIARALAERAEQ